MTYEDMPLESNGQIRSEEPSYLLEGPYMV
jgi:hypothetical protein